MKIRNCLILLLILRFVNIYSQTCPSINAQVGTGPNVNILYGQCATLTASVVPVFSTTNYTINPITYSPLAFSGGTAAIVAIDDAWSDSIDIGFNFCYFGNTFHKLVMGGNGEISFNIASANSGEYFGFNNILPNLTDHQPNTICGVYRDLNSQIGGTITYDILGVAPCRKFVANWINVPLYNCTTILSTFQVVLYESTNFIDIYIQNSSGACAWQGGKGLAGIQNATGTMAVAPPGRNILTSWTATNEAWRFIPNGASAYTVNWTGPGGFSSTGLSATPCPTINSVYTAIMNISDCIGSTNTFTSNVQVTVLPIANFSLSNTTICQTQSISITDLSSPLGSITAWNYSCIGATPSSSTLQNPVLTFNTSGVYTISLTVTSSGGNATVTKTVQVNACVSPTVSITSSSVTCNGACNGSAVVSASGGAPFTYSWTPAVTGSSVVTNLCAGVHTCVITNSLGVSVTKTINIAQPPPINILTPNYNVCAGNITVLSPTVSGGTPGYTFNWNTGSTTNNITVTPTIIPTTGYTLTVSDISGCVKTAVVTVTVNPIPSLTITPINPTICAGKTATINLSGASSYVSNPGGITLSSFTVNPITTTVYTITGTSPFACTVTRTDTVKVLTLPPIFSTVSSNTVCLGSSVTFSNSGGVSYTLSPTTFTGNIINVTPTVLGTTTFTVLGSGPLGCINTKTISVLTYSLPTVYISPTNTTICAGESVILNAGGASTYTWSGTGLIGSSQTVFPPVTTTYSLIGKDATGCENSASALVNVSLTPNVSISSPSTSVCFGYTMAISAIGATNYTWTTGATTSSIIVQPFINTTIGVIGSNGGTCKDTAAVSLTIKPLPTITAVATNSIVCQNNTVALSASGSATTYSWVTASSIGSVFSPTVTAPATYTVYGLGSNGCANLSTVSVNVYNSQVVEAMATPSIICSGANAVLTVVGGTPTIASYQNEVVSPSVNSSYPITIVDVNGCLYDRTAYVNVTTDCLVQIYSGFTPNGDGINDNWQIGNIENYPDNKVYIVNRWGHKLFETTHYNNNSNTWNGMYNGAIVPSGTYFYVIELNGGKDVMKGWLEITGR